MSLSLSLPIEPSGFGGVFYDEGGMFERDVLPSSCKLVGILGHVGAGVISSVSFVSLLSGVGGVSGLVGRACRCGCPVTCWM